MVGVLRRIAPPILAFFAGAGLEVSGFEDIRLAFALWSFAGLYGILAFATWEPVRSKIPRLPFGVSIYRTSRLIDDSEKDELSTVDSIGDTVLERRIIRSLWLNGYFFSRNQKREDCTFAIRAFPPPSSGFSVPRSFNIIQPKGTPNVLEISGGLRLVPNQAKAFQALSQNKRAALILDLRQKLASFSGIQFAVESDPVVAIDITRSAILSKTNEDSFYLEELLAYNQAIELVVSILDQHL